MKQHKAVAGADGTATSPPPAAGIRIDLRRGPTTVSVSWLTPEAAACAA